MLDGMGGMTRVWYGQFWGVRKFWQERELNCEWQVLEQGIRACD